MFAQINKFNNDNSNPKMKLLTVQGCILDQIGNSNILMPSSYYYITEIRNRINEHNLRDEVGEAFEALPPSMEIQILTMPEEDFLRFPKAILLIGMLCASHLPSKGAAKRDTIAAFGLAALGYFVTSLNNDVGSAHANPGRHIEVNLNSARHVKEEIESTFPSYYPGNDDIVCDIGIFRSPSGYVDQILRTNFWTGTLLLLLGQDCKVLKPGGKIHFGNIAPIRERLREFQSLIAPLCESVDFEVAEGNPLHMARELMSKELEECGDHITNATQMIPILEQPHMRNNAVFEYIVLTKKCENASELRSYHSCSSSSSNSATPPNRLAFYSSEKTGCRVATPHPKRSSSGLRRLSEIIDLTGEEETDEEMISPPFKRRMENEGSVGRVPFADFNNA